MGDEAKDAQTEEASLVTMEQADVAQDIVEKPAVSEAAIEGEAEALSDTHRVEQQAPVPEVDESSAVPEVEVDEVKGASTEDMALAGESVDQEGVAQEAVESDVVLQVEGTDEVEDNPVDEEA